jgi:hypothetical protein
MTNTNMTNQNEPHSDGSATTLAAGQKKPYVKPSFRYEKVFVTTALSCGKVSFTESNCVHNTKSS